MAARACILIVDDYVDICRALVRLMQARGFDAYCVTSGAEALEHLRNAKPSVVVLDDHMPDISGLDVLKVIQTDPTLPKVPVIMHSAGADDGRRDEALRLGAVGWVRKGTMDWFALADKIADVVGTTEYS